MARTDFGAIVARKVFPQKEQIATVRNAGLTQRASILRAPAELCGAVSGPAKSPQGHLGEQPSKLIKADDYSRRFRLLRSKPAVCYSRIKGTAHTSTGR